MELDTFRILTQRQKGTCHRETEVTIDWQGITEQQLRVMARAMIVHVIQCKYKGGDPIPEKVKLRATDMVHEEIYVPLPHQPRKKKDWLDKMLEDLSEEERAKMLQELEGLK